jgi:hypothetical protein
MAELEAIIKNGKKRIENIDIIIARLYEDNVTGKVSDERYMKLVSGYETEQSELVQKIEFSEKRLSENKQKKSYPSFKGTVTAVSRHNHVPARAVTSALRELMNKECITQQTVQLDQASVKTLRVDWQKCKILGYWE